MVKSVPFPVPSFYRAVELVDEQGHDLQSQAFCAAEVQRSGQSHSVVRHPKLHAPVLFPAEPDPTVPFLSPGKGVLEGVRHELVDQKAARHGRIDVQLNGLSSVSSRTRPASILKKWNRWAARLRI